MGLWSLECAARAVEKGARAVEIELTETRAVENGTN